MFEKIIKTIKNVIKGTILAPLYRVEIRECQTGEQRDMLERLGRFLDDQGVE